MKPVAVEKFEIEKNSMDPTASIFLEHPIDRLKYHIIQTKGRIVKSEFSNDGTAFVVWESKGKQYRAWSSWPDNEYQITWKAL